MSKGNRWKIISVSAPGIVWMSVLGNVQLGLRHPENNGPSAQVAHAACMDLLEKLVAEGVLTADEAAEIYHDEMIAKARGWARRG